MPAPIDKIGLNAVVPKTDDISSGAPKDSKFKEALQSSAKPEGPSAQGTDLPPMKEVNAVERKQLQHDLRKRMEVTGSTDPKTLFGNDLNAARKRIDIAVGKVDGVKNTPGAEGVRDRLAAIEAQFQTASSKAETMPATNNLRDLLSLQSEMYKMGQNVEILSKVVDAATSGVKSTLQMQV
jgi:hypothetical protein